MPGALTAYAALGFVMTASTALGATISISASADNTLYEDPIGATSNGSGQHLFAGLTASGVRRRGLVRFDVAGALPAGAVIESVSLTLHLSRTITGTEEVSLHRLLASWGEGASTGVGEEGAGAPAQTGDATWLHRSWATVPWSTPGGDFEADSSASLLVVGPRYYTWSSEAMAAEVQSWVVDPGSNFGWLILGNESAPSTAKRFDSRENDDPAFRPVLTVTFIPAPAPFMVSATATMCWLRRRHR